MRHDGWFSLLLISIFSFGHIWVAFHARDTFCAQILRLLLSISPIWEAHIRLSFTDCIEIWCWEGWVEDTHLLVSDRGNSLVDEESKILYCLCIELNVFLELVNLVLEVLKVLVSCLLDILVKKSLFKISLIFSGVNELNSFLISSLRRILF